MIIIPLRRGIFGFILKMLATIMVASDYERRFRTMMTNLVALYALEESQISFRRLRIFAEALV